VGKIFGKIKDRVQNLTAKTDQYQQAAANVEVGQRADAQESLQTEPSAETPRKLVVVGRESVFSQEIVDYALEMAERMSYEIIALNTAPLSCDTFKLFSASRDKICEDFENLSQKTSKPFRTQLNKKGFHSPILSNSVNRMRSLKKLEMKLVSLNLLYPKWRSRKRFPEQRTAKEQSAKLLFIP